MIRCLVLWALLGCGETVLHSPNESEANRAAAALERHGVPAELIAGRNGRTSTFELRVDAADAPRARELLAAFGMPRAQRAGAAALAAGSSLVSSPVEERARIATAVAGDVEQSLEAIDGVIEARVHLTFPLAEDSAFGSEVATRPPRASTLVRHLGDAPPLAADDVQRLVAGAVDGLAAADVEVVFRTVRVPPAADGWESLGPFVLRSGGRAALVVLLAVGLAIIASLAALLVWSRVLLRRARRHDG
ncbi:MAG: secretion protein [Deltaproteobacteria bacterium]|nr:secretion protein [Deltaproteobacteria bacterium]